jgi:hypothetical protein
MNNLARRLRKLESVGRDATGLVPHSDAWYAFYEDKLFRLIDERILETSGFHST